MDGQSNPALVDPERIRPSGDGEGDGGIRNGHIELIVGPMFSGKSTELLRRVRRLAIARRKVCIIKHLIDDRYAGDSEDPENAWVTTHDGDQVTALRAAALADVAQRSTVADADVVAVDEGQFFSDLPEACERWANSGKVVLVAALSSTFQRQSFRAMHEMLALSERVTKLHAVCVHCQRDAAFSRRLGSETAVEVIGGAESYEAVCRRCFFATQS